jgi:50S ribosomal subunit-associated GTPase HflX
MQNKCLRTITEAFKVTLISMLEAEIYIFLIDAHLDQLQTSTRIRLRFERLQRLIANSCRTIVNKLRDRAERRRDRNSISSEKKHN